MKNIILSVLLIMSCISCKQSKSIITTSNNQFEVKKIKEAKFAYIIDVSRNDSTFKIISDKKDTEFLNCKKIKKGKYYDLRLNQIFPIKDANGSYYSMVKEFEYKGIIIQIDKKFHSTVYYVVNLNGICIVE